MIRLGIIAYASDTGLGIQTWELQKNLNPVKALVINLSRYNNMPIYLERFPGARVTDGVPGIEDLEWLTDEVDAVFVCETPLNFALYEICKRKGVVAIQQYNYEFLDYFIHPDWATPDVLAAPTNWNIEAVQNLARQIGVRKVMEWPVPVNRDLIKFRQINQCQTFVHIVGRPAVHDRNGTITFLQAAAKIGTRAKYKIYIQPPSDARAKQYFEPVRQALEHYKDFLKLEIIENVTDYQEITATGDVLVLPRRYGGLCLPMNEALAAGMPVIMPEISPNSDKLPNDWLIPAQRIKEFAPRPVVQIYEADVNYLAMKMAQFFNSSGYMADSNRQANKLAQTMSWEVMKPWYEESLEQVCQK